MGSYTNSFVRTDEVCPNLLKAPFVCNVARRRAAAIALTDDKCIPQKKHRQSAKNHTLFRDIVKTGASFDDFTQESVNLIFLPVNAVKRKQFNGKSAYDIFSFFHSEVLASALGIPFVSAVEVIQSPKLRKFFEIVAKALRI